jgi:small subunit ribosomal protein S1
MSETPQGMERLLSEMESFHLPRQGELLQGVVIALGPQGAVVDVGLKRDGVIPISDLGKQSEERPALRLHDEICVMVVEPEDADGNLVISLSQARESGDWLRARRLLEEDGIIEAAPCGYNRGGLLVRFGYLRGFIPASHLSGLPRGVDEEERMEFLASLVGQRMPLRVLEADPKRQRLVLSERKAIRQWRLEQKGKLIERLAEGEIRSGVVTGLCDYGAFVDIGGADGLIHISELSWKHVHNPADILSVGQNVTTMVVDLDAKARHIALSLKRLQPNPWEEARDRLACGQILDGTIARYCDHGAFVCVAGGLQGLICTGLPHLAPGSTVRVRVVAFDPEKQKLELEWLDTATQHSGSGQNERALV